MIRISRGQPRPSEEAFATALKEDRQRLHLPPSDGTGEIEIAGPYPVLVDGSELDEYVAWER